MDRDSLELVEQALIEAERLARDQEQQAAQEGETQRVRWCQHERERVAELLREVRELRAAEPPAGG